MNDAVYEKLVEVAKARATITFPALGEATGMKVDSRNALMALGFVLDEIADHEVAAGRPLLPVVVVQEGTNMPGAGLFKYARKKKLQKTDDLTFFATELKRVYEHWGTAKAS